MPMFPKRAAPYVFAFLLTGFMTFIVPGIATVVAAGVPPNFLGLWMGAWFSAWVIAFPALIVVRPFVQRLTERLAG
ncbi:hypothetical protein BURK1_02530 [Burkholderiales bacterium]|nr:hypothetical protein BURK1_02530 [Burkholderiales bacterium]